MSAPLHAILQRDELPDRGLFILPRPAPPLDPDEELEREMAGALDEIIAVTTSQSLGPTNQTIASPAHGTISRRDAVQSLEDEDAALMFELVQPHRSSSNASIDSDFSMSLGLSQNNGDADEDDSVHPPVAAGSRQYSMSLELRETDSEQEDATPPASAAAASASSSSAAAASQGSRQNSMVWSEIGEASRASTPILPQSPLSLDYDPNPFVPPLETREQIEARERAELEARHAKLAEIAERHAEVARQQQMQLLSEQQSAREGIQGNPPDIANVSPAQGRMSVSLMNGLVAKYSSQDLGDPFYFMQPTTYTKARKFRLTGRNPQRLIWSIKLDGNRALWDGWQQILISKSRRIKIKPPSFWRLLMPRDCYLDGELFVPSEKRVNGTRTEFAASLYEVAPVWRIHPDSISGQNSNIHDNQWLKFQFHAFDILGVKLNDKPLSERLGVLEATLRQFEHSHPTEKPVFRRVYTANLEGTTTEQVHKSIERLLEYYGKGLGAEGIVIKDLNSPYKHRSPWPSSDWLKAKYYEDVEAKVEVDRYVTAKGEKSVIIMLPDQQETKQVVTFANGNLISANKLKKGMIVTVAFMPDRDRPESDKLRTPIIRSIVEDGTTWQDVQTRQREKEEEARQNY